MAKDKLKRLVEKGIKKAIREGRLAATSVPEIIIERPKEKLHGDFATNVAFVLSSEVKKPPLKVAELIVKGIPRESVVEKVEVAPPGFINFYLRNAFFFQAIDEIRKKDRDFGNLDLGKGEKVQVEFVSANPTSPLHVGHGRWAALGDTFARLLKKAGYKVEREFYINDFGLQMELFGESLALRYKECFGEKVDFPETGYKGRYLVELAQRIADADGEKYLSLEFPEMKEVLAEKGKNIILEEMKKVLEAMGVAFDRWFSEKSLHASGKVREAVSKLEKKGYVYKKDRALWFKSTAFGDEKDRVLVRETGEPTYFAADVAYHISKFDRGFEKVFDIWGADHHGYVKRMEAALKALGYPDGSFEVILGQLVNLISEGKPLKMSKRTGEMVTLDELLSEVGKDALRFFFLMRGTDAPVDFDVDLALKKSEDNPVYYVQYAHARICSIIKYAQERGLKIPVPEKADVSLLRNEAELDLVRKLVEFEEVVEECVVKRAPHKLTKYAQDLATCFHVFYTKCRVVTEDEALTKARLCLVDATRIVLRNTLELLGVNAPEKM